MSGFAIGGGSGGVGIEDEVGDLRGEDSMGGLDGVFESCVMAMNAWAAECCSHCRHKLARV